MPRYFFHVRDGDTLHRDTTGRDFAGTEAVLKEAQHYAAGVLREAAVRGQDASVRVLEVVDEEGEQVVTLPFVRSIEDDPAEEGLGGLM
jgi:hypothetical protein